MAAIAGSKGRLEIQRQSSGSFQMSLVKKLLDGSLSSAEAAVSLIHNGALREIGIDTNMVCNLRCQYCYLDDRPRAPGTVPLDELKVNLHRLARTGTKLFAFIGKEPLSDERAPELLASLDTIRADGLKFRTGLVTNGTLVHRWLDRLVDSNLSYIDVSIDGLTDAENRLRGSEISMRVRDGVEAIVRSPLRERFATATVLTAASMKSYPQFVEEMFQSGVVTCFASPVLRFAMSNEVADYAVTMDDVWRLIEQLATRLSSHSSNQIMLDLPYRYTWDLFNSGRIATSAVQEDACEVLHWRFAESNVYLKLNPFPYSYWRAVRITHDGKAVINMDLAAHPQYADCALGFQSIQSNVFEAVATDGRRFLTDFIDRHVGARTSGPVFERDVAAQYEQHRALKSAA